MRNDVFDLTADRDVTDATLLYSRSFQEVVRVETNLIVKENDEFPREPLLDLIRRFTIVLVHAFVKLDGDLLSLLRVVVTPDNQVLFVDALEFFPVGLHLGE